MYRKSSNGWKKHLDFILWNLFCMELSFYIAFVSRHGFADIINQNEIYRQMAVVLLFMDFIVCLVLDTFKNVIKRGYYKEFVKTLQQVVTLECVVLFYMFVMKLGDEYSRQTLLIFPVIYLIISYIVRCLWKYIVRTQLPNISRSRSMLVIGSMDQIIHSIDEINHRNYGSYVITGIALIDGNYVGHKIQGYDVVANRNDVLDYLCQNWVDEVYISVNNNIEYPENLVEAITEMGIVVHIELARLKNLMGQKQFTEKIGHTTVLTTSINTATTAEALVKRTIDILGGLVGCLITLVLTIIIGPMIYIQSPGPIFFSQDRVGRNGKIFKMYKFRSMYMDAEARKAELMAQNQMEDAYMFKLEYDPRIIGSKKLPDGTIKKGIGNYIRDWSLDEFPQFFNVLKGDMSIVGTRPPLISEVEIYEYHHKSRLAMKPGITGMWQVSGRSNITEFDEVVKLDREYINNWTIGMDIKILLKTIMVVFKKDGAM